MKYFLRTPFSWTIIVLSTLSLSAMEGKVLSPPETPRQGITEDHFAKGILDPYRWLEDLEEEETGLWAKAQDNFARHILEADGELLGRIREQIANDGNAPDMGVPLKRGKSLFYMLVSQEYENPVLMRRDLTVDSADVLVDPGKEFVVADFRPNADGTILAYALENKDTRDKIWYFRDLKANALLPVHLNGGSIHGNPWLWEKFVYYTLPSRDDEEPGQIRSMSTRDKGESTLLFESENPASRVIPDVTDDGKYLIISSREKTDSNRVFLKSLIRADDPQTELFPSKEGQHRFIGSRENQLFFLTTHHSPKGRVLALDLSNNSSPAEKTIVPESEGTLTEAYFFHGKILAVYLENGFSVLKIFDLDQSLLATLHPPKGLLWNDFPPNWPTLSGSNDSKAYFRSLALMDAGVFEVDMEKGTLNQIFSRGQKNPGSEYTIRQVFFASYDGTQVPMTILHKAGIKLDQKTPVLMNVYGAYGFTFIPFFNPMYRVFVEAGGIYAVPNIRGGGIYGQDWYDAGRGNNKWNSVQDTVFAARWLLDNGYTVPKRLAVTGNSAGTIPAAVAAIDHPDLFGAVLLEVPLADMIRYRLWTHSWNTEFPSSETKEGLEAALKISPYHLLQKKMALPPVLITAGDQDHIARVSHAYKLAAALQFAQTNPCVPLLHIDWGTGHGANKTSTQRINTWSYELAFLFRVLNMSPEPSGHE